MTWVWAILITEWTLRLLRRLRKLWVLAFMVALSPEEAVRILRADHLLTTAC